MLVTRVHVITMIRVGNKKDKVGVYKVGVSSTKFKFTTLHIVIPFLMHDTRAVHDHVRATS